MTSKNQVDFAGSDEAALAYIRKRGYASYSSMCLVRDKREPEPFKETEYYTFGKELHSRFLERKKIVTMSPANEALLKEMVHSLANDSMTAKIMEPPCRCEIDFTTKVNGMTVHGRIDIKSFAVADLKTTRLNNKNAFANSMDFLQAALYTRVAKLKDFYYIGISKQPPHNVMVFNVNQYKERIAVANQQLDYLTKYIKSKL